MVLHGCAGPADPSVVRSIGIRVTLCLHTFDRVAVTLACTCLAAAVVVRLRLLYSSFVATPTLRNPHSSPSHTRTRYTHKIHKRAAASVRCHPALCHYCCTLLRSRP